MNHKSFIKSLKASVFLIAFLIGAMSFNQAFAWQGDLGGDEYRAQEARSYQRVQIGTVLDIRMVRITRESSSGNYIGAAAGAILGGVIGNQVGKGSGRTIATAIGGTIGGVAGNTAGAYAGREVKQAAEITVSMNNGNAVSIVQELDGATAQLRPGDRVRLIEGQAVRVVKIGGYNM